MSPYDYQLVISIFIRVVGFLWSIVLLKKIRDWRISLLTLMLLLMVFQQTLRWFDIKSEIPGTIVSIIVLLVTVFVGKMILVQKENHQQMRELNEKLEQKVTERTAELEKNNRELTDALAQVKTLSGMLPICASCKKIRNDKGYWEQLENYIGEHSTAVFSHGICPDCAKILYPDLQQTD